MRKPILIDVNDFRSDRFKRFVAREVTLAFYDFDIGAEPDHYFDWGDRAALDIFYIVVGERNVWTWRYDRNEDGLHYLDPETGEVAYVVDRFDIPV